VKILQKYLGGYLFFLIHTVDFNFYSFYTVCFSVCLRCGVTLAAFLCPVIAVEFEMILS